MQFQLGKTILSKEVTQTLINSFKEDKETDKECAKRLMKIICSNDLTVHLKDDCCPPYCNLNLYHWHISYYYIGNKNHYNLEYHEWYKIPSSGEKAIAYIHENVESEYKIIKEDNMKTLKTWEMIKELTENPNLKFKRIKSCCEVEKDECLAFVNNVLCWYKDRNFPLQISSNHIQEDEWEIIKEPVDFITAVNSGKRIKSEFRNVFGDPNAILNYFDLTLEEIRGKWYIED